MLTQDQINQIRQAAGATPLNVNSSTPTQSLSDRLGLNNPAPTTPTPTPSLMDKLKGRATGAVQDVKQAGQNIEDISNSKDLNPAQKAIGNVASAGAVPLHVLGQAGGAIGDAISSGIDKVNELTPDYLKDSKIKSPGSDLPSPFANDGFSKAADKWQEFSGKNPEIARGLEDIGNIFNITAAGEVAGLAKAGIKKSAEAGLKESITKGAKAVKNKVITSEEKATLDAIRQSPDNMTKNQLRQAVDEGRQVENKTATGGTKVDYTPSTEESRAAEILKASKIKGAKKQDVVEKIKSEISTRGAEAEKYLADNPKNITTVEQTRTLRDLESKADQNMTDAEFKTYQDQINLFKKQLPKTETGIWTTKDYYKALKKWEQNIAEHLPKGQDKLLDPTGVASAKIHAAADIRTAARDLIASKHPEFSDKMYDLMSLFHVKPTAIENAVKNKTKTFMEKNPKIKAASKIAGTAALGATGYAGAEAILGN